MAPWMGDTLEIGVGIDGQHGTEPLVIPVDTDLVVDTHRDTHFESNITVIDSATGSPQAALGLKGEITEVWIELSWASCEPDESEHRNSFHDAPANRPGLAGRRVVERIGALEKSVRLS